MMIMVGLDLIVVGGSEVLKIVWYEIENKGCFKYERFMVYEDKVVNCLYINDILIYLLVSEILSSYGLFK